MSDWHNKSHEERVEELLDQQAEAMRDVADHLGRIASALEALVASRPPPQQGVTIEAI